MTSPRQLYALQEVDQDIAAKQTNLADIKTRLENNQAVASARAQLEAWQTRSKELLSQQHQIQLEEGTLREKLQGVEKRLYSGTVIGTRELSGMEEERRLLQEKLRQQEDGLLELMVEVEDVQSSLHQAEEEFQVIETDWKQESNHLLQAQERLTNELSLLDKNRQVMATQVVAADLSLYETLRASRLGQAVAKVERGMCQGCRISLPTRELQLARTAQTLVRCNSCGRILFGS